MTLERRGGAAALTAAEPAADGAEGDRRYQRESWLIEMREAVQRVNELLARAEVEFYAKEFPGDI